MRRKLLFFHYCYRIFFSNVTTLKNKNKSKKKNWHFLLINKSVHFIITGQSGRLVTRMLLNFTLFFFFLQFRPKELCWLVSFINGSSSISLSRRNTETLHFFFLYWDVSGIKCAVKLLCTGEFHWSSLLKIKVAHDVKRVWRSWSKAFRESWVFAAL